MCIRDRATSIVRARVVRGDSLRWLCCLQHRIYNLLAQNALAHTAMMTKNRDHITPVLARLHWLPVTARIQFKIALLTFKTLTTHQPFMTYSSHTARHDNSGPSVTTCLKFRRQEPVSLNAASPTVLHTSGTVNLTSSLAT